MPMRWRTVWSSCRKMTASGCSDVQRTWPVLPNYVGIMHQSRLLCTDDADVSSELLRRVLADRVAQDLMFAYLRITDPRLRDAARVSLSTPR